jgi:hypothetical protein
MYASPPKSHHLECQGQGAEHSQEPGITTHRFWRSWSMYGAYNECVRRLTFCVWSESYRAAMTLPNTPVQSSGSRPSLPVRRPHAQAALPAQERRRPASHMTAA